VIHVALTNFTVTGIISAVISDSSADVLGDPDVRPVSCTVVFTPSVRQVYSEGHVYHLEAIKARTNTTTGALETIDVSPVKLTANTGIGLPPGELTYTVSFEDVVMPGTKGRKVDLSPFRFAAPTSATTVDLAAVTRL
jgi:hypothetical protein